MAISTDDLIKQLDEAATAAEQDADNEEHTGGSDEHRALHLGEASAYRNVIEVLVFDRFADMVNDEFPEELDPRELEQ